MADKHKSKIVRNISLILIVLGIGLYLGYWIGSSGKSQQSSDVELSCPDGCYNGGTVHSESCTCTDGFSGQCCELKTQLCKFGEWSLWTNCSVECGSAGTQYRIRENDCYDSDQCSQEMYEQRSCNVFCYNGGFISNDECVCQSGYSGKCCECKIENCQMKPWSEWSTCTRTCGPHGTRIRTRNIASYASCGGAPCSKNLTEEEDCNRECYNGDLRNYTCECKNGFTGECCDCKIQDCVMSQWTDWSECTHSCGPHGITFRTRDVLAQPECGGDECPVGKSLRQEKKCNQLCENGGHLDYENGVCKCPTGYSGLCCDCKDIDCIISEWSWWAACDGAHTHLVRLRDVIQYPECNGRKCTESLAEKRLCLVESKNNKIVPKWSMVSFGVFFILMIY